MSDPAGALQYTQCQAISLATHMSLGLTRETIALQQTALSPFCTVSEVEELKYMEVKQLRPCNFSRLFTTSPKRSEDSALLRDIHRMNHLYVTRY